MLVQAATPRQRLFPKSIHNTPVGDHRGKDTSVQRLYEGGISENGRHIVWNEWAPPALANPKKIKFEGAAIQLYHRYAQNKPGSVNEPHGNFSNVREFYVSRITIQSPFIRSELEATFAKYGLEYDTNGVAHSLWPHKALYFSRGMIAEVASTSNNGLAREHCQLLGTELENALADILDAIEDLRNTKEITFSLLWTLFPEGSIFATKHDNSIIAFRVKQCSQSNVLKLKCETIGFDGFRYGTTEYDIAVDCFEGRKSLDKIPDLPVYDLGGEETMRCYLLERGKKMLDFQHIHYVAHIPSREDETTEFDTVRGSQPANKGVSMG